MDLMTEFVIKILATFLLSGLIFVVMMKLQKRKQEDAERKFRLTLLSKGINPDLEEK